jgi:hypothetical protein
MASIVSRHPESTGPEAPPGQVVALARYLAGTQAHTASRHTLHSPPMESVAGDIISNFPWGQNFVMRGPQLHSHFQQERQLPSLVMLRLPSLGGSLALEVPLTSVCSVKGEPRPRAQPIHSLELGLGVGSFAISCARAGQPMRVEAGMTVGVGG